MASTITTVKATSWFYVCTVAIPDADATSGNIPHGLGDTPDLVTWIFTVAPTIATVMHVSVTTINATNIVITKSSTAANSGFTARLYVARAQRY